jgi:hypothetical protein
VVASQLAVLLLAVALCASALAADVPASGALRSFSELHSSAQ